MPALSLLILKLRFQLANSRIALPLKRTLVKIKKREAPEDNKIERQPKKKRKKVKIKKSELAQRKRSIEKKIN